jgi:hypothetical protein
VEAMGVTEGTMTETGVDTTDIAHPPTITADPLLLVVLLPVATRAPVSLAGFVL